MSRKFSMAKTVLNKSDFAGINYINILSVPLIILAVLGATWVMAADGNWLLGLLVIFVFLAGVFSAVLSIGWISLFLMKRMLKGAGEKIDKYAFGNLETNNFSQESLEFHRIGEFFTDVLIVFTDKKNIYIRPTAAYTRQKPIKIPLSSILSVDSDILKIDRTEGKELDAVLPLDRVNFRIKTSEKIYEILLHKKIAVFFDYLVEEVSKEKGRVE